MLVDIWSYLNAVTFRILEMEAMPLQALPFSLKLLRTSATLPLFISLYLEWTENMKLADVLVLGNSVTWPFHKKSPVTEQRKWMEMYGTATAREPGRLEGSKISPGNRRRQWSGNQRWNPAQQLMNHTKDIHLLSSRANPKTYRKHYLELISCVQPTGYTQPSMARNVA